MKNHYRAASITGIVSLAIILSGCGAASERSAQGPQVDASIAPEIGTALQKEGPVQIIDQDFLSASIHAEMMAQLLEKMGGEASTLKIADINSTWPAMAKADNLVNPEAWDIFFGPQIEEYVEKERSVVQLGTLSITAEEGWYVPTYVIKGDPERGIEPACPGLPDWKALNDCAHIFASPETGGKGKYLTGPAGWIDYYGDAQRIKNLGLNYEVVAAGSEAALVAEIKRAYDRGEPLLSLMWSPHFVTQKYDLTRIEFPPYTKECWGTTFACGWQDPSLLKLAGNEFPEKHPTAADFVSKFSLSDDDLGALMVEMEESQDAADVVVKKWIDENPDVWSQWLPSVPSES